MEHTVTLFEDDESYATMFRLVAEMRDVRVLEHFVTISESLGYLDRMAAGELESTPDALVIDANLRGERAPDYRMGDHGRQIVEKIHDLGLFDQILTIGNSSDRWQSGTVHYDAQKEAFRAVDFIAEHNIRDLR